MKRLIALCLLLASTSAFAQDYMDGSGTGTPAIVSGIPPTATTGTGANRAAGASSATINLPASISSGEVLHTLATFAAGSVSAYDQGTGGEYTETMRTSSATMDSADAYKVADGAEGATAAATWTGISQASFITAKFASTTDTAPTCGTAVNTTSANPDPPSASFTAPATIYTWVSVDSSVTTVDADPSGYAYSCATSSATGTRTRVCMCQATASGDCSTGDPTSWTLSTSTEVWMQTCAIEDN